MTPQQIAWLYMALAVEQILISLPAFGNYYRVRKLSLMRYFGFRALMTGISHMTAAVALVYVAYVLNITSGFVLLVVWMLGDLGKIIGESALFADLWLILNGHSAFWRRAVTTEPPTDKEG